jgi:cobaltochelatase CobT
MNRNLNNAFPIVAAALGDKLGVKVRVGGQEARTDGDIIQIPSYDGDDPDYRDVAWGYLAHEAAHVRYTEMSYFNQVASSPIRKALLNILEDVRIEKRLAEVYPGTRLTIEKTVRKLIDNGDFAAPTPDDHPAAVLQAFLLFGLRRRELRQTALSDLADSAERMLEDRFPPGAVTRLFGLLSEVPGLTGTRDCLSLTDRILRMIREELEKANEENPSGPDEPGGQDRPTGQHQPDRRDGDSDDSSRPGTEEGNDSGVLPDGRKTKDDSRSSGQAPDDDRKAAADGEISSPSSSGRDSKDDMEAWALRAVLSAGDGEIGQDLFERARDAMRLTASQSADISLPTADEPPKDVSRGRELLDRSASESGRIRATLQGLVQSSLLRKPVYKRSGHRVDGNRLYRIATGDARVFDRRSPQAAPNTAVHVLVDRSPSMKAVVIHEQKVMGLRIDLAWEASMALALALEGIPGVNPAVTAFPGRHGADDRVYRVMDHGQRVRQRASCYGFGTEGGTPLAQGLWYAASRLLACREPRKIILALTDGEPDSLDATQDILARCAATGIEVVGIGLGLEVGQVFERSVSILHIHELRARLFELSRDLLIAA